MLRYRRKLHKWPNLSNPVTFCEKVQWLKVYYRNPLYTRLADKAAVKSYVDEILGPGYTIPTYGVYKSSSEIDWDSFPESFVLKCTHDSGGIRICKDKASFDKKEASRFLDKRLRRDYSRHKAEWGYKDIPHRIIAEAYIPNSDTSIQPGLIDYKFWCFDGKPYYIMVCLGRHKGHAKYYFHDLDWNFIRFNHNGLDAPADFSIPRPENLDEMCRIATKLCQGFPHIRVDLYNTGGKVLFSEMTFFHKSGIDPDLLPETDKRLGELYHLPERNY